MRFAISTGHGLYVRGASDIIDEVDEARRVVPELAKCLERNDHHVVTFNDDVSTTQNENLHRIVNWHNHQERDLDISCHFNAYMHTEGARGVEVLYVTEDKTAAEVSAAISRAGGLINRGAHKRTDLYFLNKTAEPALLLEVCFVDAAADVEQYQNNFDAICEAIADAIAPDLTIAENTPLVELTGKVSSFGGPDDMGVDADEPLAFIHEIDQQPDIFLDEQPPHTTGLARRLDPETFYVACRWDYDITDHDMLLEKKALVRAPSTGEERVAYPADWGPHTSTGRVADISPGLMTELGIGTDDVVEVTFPAPPVKKAHRAR